MKRRKLKIVWFGMLKGQETPEFLRQDLKQIGLSRLKDRALSINSTEFGHHFIHSRLWLRIKIHGSSFPLFCLIMVLEFNLIILLLYHFFIRLLIMIRLIYNNTNLLHHH